jgi:hypothetical protein
MTTSKDFAMSRGFTRGYNPTQVQARKSLIVLTRVNYLLIISQRPIQATTKRLLKLRPRLRSGRYGLLKVLSLTTFSIEFPKTQRLSSPEQLLAVTSGTYLNRHRHNLSSREWRTNVILR